MLGGRGQPPEPETAARVEPPVPTASAPPAAAETPGRAATPPPVIHPGVTVDLSTRRRVWMRVTLDGARAFEREIPADQRIPLRADRSIVIRAGDAGAVAITHNGRDAGLLGRDGVVATREFTPDAAPRR
jgi:hypothetical protein